MAAVRIGLMAASAALLLLLLALWASSGHMIDLLPLLIAIFLSTNIVYLFLSAPKVKFSDMFDQAATGLAFASLKLQHEAKQARLRESAVERTKAEFAENSLDKVRAAEEFLRCLQQKTDFVPLRETGSKQIPSYPAPNKTTQGAR